MAPQQPPSTSFRCPLTQSLSAKRVFGNQGGNFFSPIGLAPGRHACDQSPLGSYHETGSPATLPKVCAQIKLEKSGDSVDRLSPFRLLAGPLRMHPHSHGVSYPAEPAVVRRAWTGFRYRRRGERRGFVPSAVRSLVRCGLGTTTELRGRLADDAGRLLPRSRSSTQCLARRPTSSHSRCLDRPADHARNPDRIAQRSAAGVADGAGARSLGRSLLPHPAGDVSTAASSSRPSLAEIAAK